jgi:hypothetical protein
MKITKNKVKQQTVVVKSPYSETEYIFSIDIYQFVAKEGNKVVCNIDNNALEYSKELVTSRSTFSGIVYNMLKHKLDDNVEYNSTVDVLKPCELITELRDTDNPESIKRLGMYRSIESRLNKLFNSMTDREISEVSRLPTYQLKEIRKGNMLLTEEIVSNLSKSFNLNIKTV